MEHTCIHTFDRLKTYTGWMTLYIPDEKIHCDKQWTAITKIHVPSNIIYYNNRYTMIKICTVTKYTAIGWFYFTFKMLLKTVDWIWQLISCIWWYWCIRAKVTQNEDKPVHSTCVESVEPSPRIIKEFKLKSKV